MFSTLYASIQHTLAQTVKNLYVIENKFRSILDSALQKVIERVRMFLKVFTNLSFADMCFRFTLFENHCTRA